MSISNIAQQSTKTFQKRKRINKQKQHLKTRKKQINMLAQNDKARSKSTQN